MHCCQEACGHSAMHLAMGRHQLREDVMAGLVGLSCRAWVIWLACHAWLGVGGLG